MAPRLGVFRGDVAVHGVRAVNLACYLYCGGVWTRNRALGFVPKSFEHSFCAGSAVKTLYRHRAHSRSLNLNLKAKVS
jgi:hypothetical protein